MGIEQLFDGSMDEPETPVIEAPVEVVAEPEPAPEPVAIVEAPKEEEPRHVPLATFLDTRDEAKRYKRELEQARAELEQRQTATTPDPLDDPNGYAASIEQRVQTALVGQRFETSEAIAKQMYGPEAVDAAGLWAAEKAKSNPGFVSQYMQQPHPIDWIVQQHKQDKLVSDIGGDPNAWFEREAAKRGYIATPAPSATPVVAQQQPASVPPPPPRSLASLPGNGGGVSAVPVGPMAGLDAVFQR